MTDAIPRPVLLVEDDVDLRESLALLLQEEGYGVVQAPNGRQALAQLERTRPFVILLDLMMPEMDGMQFLAALRERPPHDDARAIPVVVLTAASAEIDAAPEVRDVVRKPIPFDRFLPLLRGIYDEYQGTSAY